MVRANEQRVQLRRESSGVAWGFRLQGGREANQPLSVQRVFNGSPSDGHLQRGDVIVGVDNHDVSNMYQTQAHDILQSTGLVMNLAILRSGSDSYDSYTAPAAESTNYGHQQQADRYSTGGGNVSQSSGGTWKPQTNYPAPSSPRPQSSPYQATSGHAQQDQSGYQQGSYQAPSQFSPRGGAQYPSGDQNYYDSAPTYKSQATATFASVQGGGGRGGDGHRGDAGHQQQQYPQQQQQQPQQKQYPQQQQQYNQQQQQYPQHQEYHQQEYHHEPEIVRQPRSDEGDEDYEQKSVSNIKSMFSKPDQTGTQGAPRIRRAHPKAPMYRADEGSSFSTPQYGQPSSAPKSSLTPSRPGAIQRGAADVRPSSYVPMPLPDVGSKTIRLYGQEDTGPKPKYTGGFAGVNALIKPMQPTAPVRRPPGQKKPDFDPNQSSVLRVLHEEEQRSKSGPRGQNVEEEPRSRGQQPRPQQPKGPPQHKPSTGQQWQHQQAGQVSGPPKPQAGSSLQALLERDQQNNPQEDPEQNRRGVPQPSPGQGEYRRPGTNYKPSQNPPSHQANLDEEYPLPASYTERYNYPTTASTQYSGKPTSAGNTQSYQSAGNPQSYGNTYQTPGDYPTYQSTASFQSAGSYPAAGKYETTGYPASKYTGSGYQISGGGYPATSYGSEGIPVSDF